MTEFFYERAMLPGDSALRRTIHCGAQELYEKLIRLEPQLLDISDYSKRFFGGYLKDLHAALQRYSYIMLWCLHRLPTPLERCTFLDYGGGSGVLSLLARQVGIGTVIYNDIYEVSCVDAERIAEHIGNAADHYIRGDIDDAISFIREKGISCDAVASNEVIDHVYDVEAFLSKLMRFSNGSLAVFMVTGTNGYNPCIRSQMTRLHHIYEHCSRPKVYGYKERDSIEAFLDIRRQIVVKYLDALRLPLDELEIDMLARNTRGMVKTDIQKCVQNYLDGKGLVEPSYSTNTCDPHTGNWAERLLNPFRLAGILRQSGFEADVIPGYYPSTRGAHAVLNKIISSIGKPGLLIAPSYGIYGITQHPGTPARADPVGVR
jgi:hypothetical protein